MAKMGWGLYHPRTPPPPVCLPIPKLHIVKYKYCTFCASLRKEQLSKLIFVLVILKHLLYELLHFCYNSGKKEEKIVKVPQIPILIPFPEF